MRGELTIAPSSLRCAGQAEWEVEGKRGNRKVAKAAKGRRGGWWFRGRVGGMPIDDC